MAYSVLSNKNYILLPDIIAPRTTFDESLEGTVKMYEEKSKRG